MSKKILKEYIYPIIGILCGVLSFYLFPICIFTAYKLNLKPYFLNNTLMVILSIFLITILTMILAILFLFLTDVK